MTAPTEAVPARLLVATDLKVWSAAGGRVPAARIGLRKPDTVAAPWIECRSANGFPISAAHGAWSRLVQVVVCATHPVRDELPELLVERIAAGVATWLDLRPAQLHGGTSWRPRVLSGPLDLTDTLRGADDPVHRSAVLVDVRMHSPA